MLLRTRATPLCVKRLYHTRYNGYWSLILEQATPPKPLPSLPASPRPTTALPPPTTSQTQQLTASPPSQEALTSDLHDQQQPPRPQFVWLRGEQLAIPQKPPPAENCCMSGCAYCVYDIYEEDMDTYREEMEQLRQRFSDAGEPLPEALQGGKSGGQADDDDDDDMDPTMRAFRALEKKLAAS